MRAFLLAVALFASSPQPQPLPATLSFVDATDLRITLDEPGMLYLVEFWAEGCKPCIEEIPDLERLARKYERTGRFKLISVVWGGWRGEELARFAKRYAVERGFYSDPDDWIERLNATAFPTKLLVRDGKLLQRVTGGGRGAYAKWSTIIDEALAAPTPAE